MKTVVSGTDNPSLNLRELSRYTGLLRYLSLRDVFVRYKQTRMGFGWSLLRPAINIVIFGVLSYLVDRGDSFADRFVKVSAAIVFWQLISTVMTDSSNSLASNASILTKVYFPKLLLPLSSLLVGLVDFAIAFAFFLIILVVIGNAPGPEVALFPIFALLGIVFAFAVGVAAAAASVRYRDIKYILPVLLQVLFYVSPVFVSSEFILNLNAPEWLKTLYQLNPLVFILNGYKYCFFGTFESFHPVYAVWSVIFTAILLVLSLRLFVKFERGFADYI